MAQAVQQWVSEWEDRVLNASRPPAERTVTLPPGLPERTLGFEVLAWIETNLLVPSGTYAGTPFEFTHDQALFTLWFYAVDEHGDWLFHRGIRRLAKGQGKSPVAAALALCELLGPVRFDSFDPNAPGGVRGRAVTAPVVQLAATSEDQTGVTMRLIRLMAHKRTPLGKKFQLETGKTYVETPTGGKLQVLTSSATSAEGHEATFVIADEVEHWSPRNGGDEMAAVLRRNLAKTRGARLLETCNAWSPGDMSVAEASWEDYCAQEEGLTRGQSKILYDARIAPQATVLHDDVHEGEIGLTQALSFVYGDCPWASLDSMKQEIWTPSSQPSQMRRFYLNQPTVSIDAWVLPEQWGALADPGRELVDGEDVVLFFDGSKSNDHTALVGCCMDDGFVFTAGIWAPDEHTGVINTDAVDATVRSMHERFNVIAFWADVREFESFVKNSWVDVFADTILVPAQRQGKAAALIAWDMRSHTFDFAVAAEMCKAEIEDGLFHHDGNWATARHIANARMFESRGHVSIRKESPKSKKKIDAAVCVIGARMVYRAVKASSEWERHVGAGEDWVVM